MSSNTTHSKQIARALAERTGQPYQRAFAAVQSARDGGLLPSVLDEAGRAAAVDLLEGHCTVPGPRQPGSAPTPHAAPALTPTVQSVVALYQLADMVKLGANLPAALRAAAQGTSGAPLRASLLRVADAVADGAHLSDAMASCSGVFTAATVCLVRLGEDTGQLAETLLTAAAGLERDYRLLGA